jgi:flagellar biosynthesis component FlhA
MSQPQPPLPPTETVVSIQVAAELAVSKSALDSLQESIVSSLQTHLRTLGIPGAMSVNLEQSELRMRSDGPVRVHLNARRVRYSLDLPLRLAHFLDTSLEDVPRDPHRLVLYLTLLVLEAVKTRPELLLGPKQLSSYREQLRAAGALRAAESLHLEKALGAALRCWISIADIDAVARAIESAADDAQSVDLAEAIIEALGTPAIDVRLPFAYLRQLTDGQPDWTEDFSTLRTALVHELGLPLPPFRIVFDEALDPLGEEVPPTFCFGFNALHTTPIRGLTNDEVLVNDTVERLNTPEGHATATINASNGWRAAIVNADRRHSLEESGKTVWDARQYLTMCLAEAIRDHCALLLDQSLVDQMLTTLRDADRLRDLTYELYSTAETSAVFRALLASRIPIHNVAKICDSLLDAHGKEFEEQVMYVRARMNREITNRLSRGTTVVPVYLLDAPVVDALARATVSGLDEDSETAIAEALQAELSFLPDVRPPAIVATPRTRAAMQLLVREAFPRVSVTTFDEIAPDVGVQPIARITIPTR